MAKLFVALLLVGLCVAGSSAALDVQHLKLTWGALSGMYDIPSTKDALIASDKNYLLMGHDTELKVSLYSYGKDPRVSIMFDKHGNIAGIRSAYVISDLANTAIKNGLSFPYRFDNKPMFANATYWHTPVVYNSVLFVSPDTLAAGGRRNIDDSIVDSVWVKLNGKWTKMPENQCLAVAHGFTEQGCFPTMGKHYFYGLTSDMDCADHQGVFLLYERHSLIGLGLIPFGSFTSGSRVWNESPPSAAVKMIVPNNRPDCLTKWTDSYGLTSLHVFFKNHPRSSLCFDETEC